MKKKLKYVMPVIFIIISVLASFFAFKQAKLLELGQIYVDSGESRVEFAGEYFAVISNIDYDAQKISVTSVDEGVLITTYDNEETVQKDFLLTITIRDQEYNPAIITSTLSDDILVIDDLEDYLFRVNLEANINYDFSLERLDSNPDQNVISIVLVNVPENIFKLRTLLESISFSAMIFAFVSLMVIIGSLFSRKK